jgi:hypothetical protein
MAQTVSRRPLTAESRVRARHNPCRICGGQVFLRVLRFYPVNIIPPLLSILLIYHHPGDEQYVRQWQQLRDVVSPRDKI